MGLTAGEVIAGRFRLERELARGGMGSIWVAQHVQLDIPVAIKFMAAEALGTPALRERFQREAKAAAKLRGAHVVRIIDHGDWKEAPYIAMELLEGEDLARRITREGRLGAAEVVAVAAQVSRALSKAHSMGIVHRDLKPENIFLATEDDQEIVKVLDFGIAKVLQPEKLRLEQGTRTGALLGSPFYISPEQASGNTDVDHRADLWSLAVVIYECLTGFRPFESDGLGDLLVQIMSKPIPVPSEVAPYLPPSFDDWWAKAVARDREHRFSSAREFTEALAAALDVRPSLADAARSSDASPVMSRMTVTTPGHAGASQRIQAVTTRLTPMPRDAMGHAATVDEIGPTLQSATPRSGRETHSGTAPLVISQDSERAPRRPSRIALVGAAAALLLLVVGVVIMTRDAPTVAADPRPSMDASVAEPSGSETDEEPSPTGPADARTTPDANTATAIVAANGDDDGPAAAHSALTPVSAAAPVPRAPTPARPRVVQRRSPAPSPRQDPLPPERPPETKPKPAPPPVSTSDSALGF